MPIRKLNSGDEPLLDAFLINHAETSMFLRSNLASSGLTYQNKPFHGEYLAAFNQSGQIAGVIAHYWNGNIMMQAANKQILDKLLSSMHTLITRPVAGILGPSKQAEHVINFLNLSNDKFAINRDEGLYHLLLKELNPSVTIEFSTEIVVKAKTIDSTILYEWLVAYHIEALGAEDNKALIDMIKVEVSTAKRWENRWILVVNNTPSSLVGFNARLPDIVQLGPVWTPVEYRNQGYARKLLSSVLQNAFNAGIKKAILFTDNPAAIKSYKSLGFELCGTYRLAILKNE